MRLIDREFTVLYDPSLKIVHHSDPIGRNFRIIHRLVWRNTMFAVIARFPFWLVPGGVAVAMARWIALAARKRELRLSDFWWGCASLAQKLPELLRQRAPIRVATIRRFRTLRREVVAPRLLAQQPNEAATPVSVE